MLDIVLGFFSVSVLACAWLEIIMLKHFIKRYKDLSEEYREMIDQILAAGAKAVARSQTAGHKKGKTVQDLINEIQSMPDLEEDNE